VIGYAPIWRDCCCWENERACSRGRQESTLGTSSPGISPVHYFVVDAPWAVRRVRTDSGMYHRRHGHPEEGEHSVGVVREYRGVVGKQDNW